MNSPFLIKSEDDYNRAMHLIDVLWDCQAGSHEEACLYLMVDRIIAWDKICGFSWDKI